MKKTIGFLLIALLCIALVVGVLVVNGKEETIENAGTVQNANPRPKFLVYQGAEYPIKRSVKTVLLIGTDNQEGYKEVTEGIVPFFSGAQADFLILVALDTEAGTAELLQINRDTMMDVPWLDVLGNYGGTEFQQICLAFYYGDGGRKSCLNTVDAVSSLLFDAPIDHYIQVPVTAISVINDLVGGVPVTMEEDYTKIHPSFRKGETVLLKGSQAEAFVRARMGLDDGTNIARMKRQRQYLDSLQTQAREAFHSDSQFTVKLLEALSEYLQSDMTAQQLSDFLTRMDTADIAPIRYAEGELRATEHYEFYPEEASLWEMVYAAYCGG